jgi:hypothetical protein
MKFSDRALHCCSSQCVHTLTHTQTHKHTHNTANRLVEWAWKHTHTHTVPNRRTNKLLTVCVTKQWVGSSTSTSWCNCESSFALQCLLLRQKCWSSFLSPANSDVKVSVFWQIKQIWIKLFKCSRKCKSEKISFVVLCCVVMKVIVHLLM